jgi:hypothetical protein
VIIGWHAHIHPPAEAVADVHSRDSNSGPWRNAAKRRKLPIGSAAKTAW